MILHGRCAALCAGLLLSIGSWTSPAQGQTPIPFDVTAPQISSSATIDQWVDTHVADMKSGDRDKVVAARQALLLPGTPNKKSDKFLEIYSKAIGAKLMSIADGNDPHAKLNAAIVVGKVAEMGGTADLSPIVVRLINDDLSPVSMFGIRAASPLIPKILGDKTLAPTDKVVPALVAAMKKHSGSEGVVIDSYQSMIKVLNTPALAAALPPDVVNRATPLVVDGIIKLMKQRAPEFGTGNLVEPKAEVPVIVFLTKKAAWNAMLPPTKADTVLIMLKMISGAADEMTAEFNKKPSSRPRMKSLEETIKGIAGGLGVIADQEGNAALKAESDKVKPFNSLTAPAQWKLGATEISAAYAAAFKVENPATSKPNGGKPADGAPADTKPAN